LSLALAVLLALWWTRLHHLDVMPLHNDEGLHLTRAVQVWNFNPFWEISDGKIVNHWLIAAFYPLHAPVFAGRIATVFVAMLGVAAGVALARGLAGERAAWIAGMLWLLTSPLFFYERTALSDAEAGALGVLATWSALWLATRGTWRSALLTGITLSLATLFKFTAAPFGLGVLLIVLLAGDRPLAGRLRHLLVIGLVGVVCFAVPLAVAVGRGGFGVAFGWLGGAGGGNRADMVRDSVGRFLLQLTDSGGLGWSVIGTMGLLLFAVAAVVGTTGVRLSSAPGSSRRTRLTVLVAAFLPLAAVLVLGREVMPRHTLTGLPILLVVAGAGIALALRWLPPPMAILRPTATLLLIGWLVLDALPYFDTAYLNPGEVSLPALDALQFVYDHSAGFGLVDAVRSFPHTVGTPTIPILASMFPDSCRRANFYSMQFTMICAAAPGEAALRDLLAQHDRVFVLVEKPPVGLDMATLPFGSPRLVAGYPRPGETEPHASVKLWEVKR
jgi:4-amino-4-deoxy-L-arabinose transferase-like glycosyltransferase